MPSFSWAGCVLAALGFFLQTAYALTPSETTEGQAIYDGGTGIEAQVSGVTLKGRAAACAGCHGHPWDGGGEGGVTAPALAWDTLSAGNGTRSGYVADTLTRTLREGVDPAGRSLHALMPRYDLSPAQVEQLIIYLKAPPIIQGVERTSIRLVTILPAQHGLRDAGNAANEAMTQEIAATNRRGGIFGRSLELITLDAAKNPDVLREELSMAAPLLVIGSVGLAARGPVADMLANQHVLNFAPIAAMAGDEDHRRIRALRPSLLTQANELAAIAHREHGCVDVDAGPDQLSTRVAQHIHRAPAVTVREPGRPGVVQISPTPSTSCEGRLILRPANESRAAIERARDEGAKAVYLSAEQTGIAAASKAPSDLRIVAATGGVGSLEDQARGNARKAVGVLVDALSSIGRIITPQKLDEALDQAGISARSEVQVWRAQ